MSEKASFGGWQAIGYMGPGESKAGDNGSSETTNFRYTGGAAKATESIAPGASVYGWTANNIPKLNDCASGSAWTVALASISDGQETMTTAAPTGEGCASLTPNFAAIDGIK